MANFFDYFGLKGISQGRSVTIPEALQQEPRLRELATASPHVITSYSIHYTKLYDSTTPSASSTR